jgi:hypothetical protein
MPPQHGTQYKYEPLHRQPIRHITIPSVRRSISASGIDPTIHKILHKIKALVQSASHDLSRNDTIELKSNVQKIKLVLNTLCASIGLSDDVLIDGSDAKEDWLQTPAGQFLQYIHSIDERLVRQPEVGTTAFWRFEKSDRSFFKRAYNLVQTFSDVQFIHKTIERKIKEDSTFIILVGHGVREEYSSAACFHFFPDHRYAWPNTNFGQIQELLNKNTTTKYVWPINLELTADDQPSDPHMEEKIETSSWPASQIVDILSFWVNFKDQLNVVVRLPGIGLTSTKAIPFIDANPGIKVIYLTKIKKILVSRIKWVKIFTAWYTRASLAPGGVRFNKMCALYSETHNM